MDADAMYEMSRVIYTYDELAAAIEAEAATVPPETWRCGWDLNDYMIEAMQVGIINQIFPDDDVDDYPSQCCPPRKADEYSHYQPRGRSELECFRSRRREPGAHGDPQLVPGGWLPVTRTRSLLALAAALAIWRNAD